MSDVDRSTIVVGIIAVIGIAAGAAWWSKPDSDHRQPAVRPNPIGGTLDSPATTKPATLYKWLGDDGVFNYTDKPPADRAFEVIRDTPNVTPVPSVVPDVPASNSSPEIPPPSK